MQRTKFSKKIMQTVMLLNPNRKAGLTLVRICMSKILWWLVGIEREEGWLRGQSSRFVSFLLLFVCLFVSLFVCFFFLGCLLDLEEEEEKVDEEANHHCDDQGQANNPCQLLKNKAWWFWWRTPAGISGLFKINPKSNIIGATKLHLTQGQSIYPGSKNQKAPALVYSG